MRQPSPSDNRCRVCQTAALVVFIELPQIPIYCNLLWPTRQAALAAPKGDMRLAFCHVCGHIYNVAFNPDMLTYTQDYENSLHFSPRFQQYATSLATHLIERYALRGQQIVEIGCGKGEFLTLLCELGNNRGVGFDPSYVPAPEGALPADARVTVFQEPYSERYTHYEAALLCCRHVLEHMSQPTHFLTMVRQTLANRRQTVLFFEVPNALFTLHDLAIWDLIYEHCSYFSPSSLAWIFQTCGFDIVDLRESMAGQFLCLEAYPGEAKAAGTQSIDPQTQVQQLAADVSVFADHYRMRSRCPWVTR
jgi:hypothetical protein